MIIHYLKIKLCQKKIILGLVFVLGLSFFATSGVDAIETESSVFQYQEIMTSPINTWVGSLSYGMRSEAVRELQQTLSGDNYTHIYPEKLTTGYFGVLTQQAVKRFQAENGLPQTGVVDENLKQSIWGWDSIPEPTSPIYLEPVCDKVCMAKGYSNGTCRNACYAGEVNLGATSDCNYCPPGVACATVMSYCCCGQEQGDSGDCTDSDGGINKYIKGKTCRPSRIVSVSTEDAVTGATSLFCKTDMCDMLAHSYSTSTSLMGADAPLLKEYYCANGVMMSKHIKCENGCADGACLKVAEEDCTLKGQRDYYPFNCCSGLVPRSCNLEEGHQEPISSARCCIACGDGICEEELESQYNCPEDCEGVCHKELNKEDCESFDGTYRSYPCPIGYPCDPKWYCECPCKTDSDCGVDRCSQGRDVCLEIRYNCENGKCEYAQKEYKGYSCASSYDPASSTPEKCLDTCGDGICKSPETQWWCPEDCKGCVGDGEVKTPLSECCAGLHVIASGYRNNISYCTSEVCGNGACRALENEWNCPQDCKTTTPPVDVQPIITLIREAINKLNSAIRLLGEISSVDGGWAH